MYSSIEVMLFEDMTSWNAKYKIRNAEDGKTLLHSGLMHYREYP